MNTVDIPGGTATFRDKEDLRGRDRNLIKAASMAASNALQKMPEEVQVGKLEGESEDEAAERLAPLAAAADLTWQESLALLELRQATVIAMLASWTLNKPLPTMDTMGDLAADLYDALEAAIGGVTNAVASAVDFEPRPPGENPTGSSPSSDSLSKDGQGSQSIPTLPSAGESTPTESYIQA